MGLSRTSLIPTKNQIIKSSPCTLLNQQRTTILSLYQNHYHHHNQSHTRIIAANKVPLIPRGCKVKQLLFTGRRHVRILFAALITLLPPILKHKSIQLSSITKADIFTFALTSGILAIFDVTKALMSKGESWRLNMLNFFRNSNAADRVTFIGVMLNLLLSAGKFIVGVGCHSSVLIADAGHSLSDLFSDFVTLWAVQVGRLPPDDDHPYGYGKFESVGSLFLSLTLFGTGLSIGLSSFMKFLRVIHMKQTEGLAAAATLVHIPTWPALVMAAASILSKEWLYRITRKVGEQLNSQVVIANAWHHRSDAYSSLLALISIGLAMFIPGFLAADLFAGILVAGMIAMTAAEIMGESVKQHTDAVTETL